MRLANSGSALVAVLETDSKQRCELPGDIASFPLVGPVLESRLLPILVRKTEKIIAEGGSIAVRESVLGGYGRIVHGLFVILLSFLMFASIRFILHGFAAFRFGRRLIRRGSRSRRGGFDISAQGFVPAGDLLARPVPWNEVTLQALDEDGIVFKGVEGQVGSASIHAGNYWVLSRWIKDRIGG